MRLTLAALFLIPLLAIGAEDPWSTVKALASGTELRVYQAGSAQPLNVKFDELQPESLIVVEKDSQVAIPRADIVRIDARESNASRMKKQTTSESNGPIKGSPTPLPPWQRTAIKAQESTSSTVTFSGKGEFKTIYRKALAAANDASKPQ